MNLELKSILRNAVYAALYVTLCFIFQPISFGPIQVRIAEALCIMVLFDKNAVFSITLGCFLSNLLVGGTPLPIVDAFLGSLATFIGLFLARFIKSDNFFLKMLPTIISNAIIIPYELIIVMGWGDVDLFGTTIVGSVAVIVTALSVAIGEIIALYVLGYILYKAIKRLNIKFY
ncbi:MAG: QueT transporter family protein [Lachnospiraceae bacterium]|nr:QueT transporter family protein [Lachnospiraceae bacterium]MBR1844934.1 QueT transporter family protein [Lachnospiraceae bacterium]